MKNLIRKILYVIVICCFVFPCMFVFSSCSNSKNGLDGKDGSNASNVDTYEVYQNAIEHGLFNGSYLDFIQRYFKINQDETSIATNYAITSVVTVTAKYNSATTSASGIIFSISDSDAFVVTNAHVTNIDEDTIKSDFKISLYGFPSTKNLSATFVGSSTTYDIAVLHIDDVATLNSWGATALCFVEDEVSVGQTVISIGNTNSNGIAVSKGVISVPSEIKTYSVVGNSAERRLIRHDCFISSGNSGGGLFNLNGEFVGMTNGGVGSESNLENYAIPSSLVNCVTKNIIKNCFNQTATKPKIYNLGLNFIITDSQIERNEVTNNVEIIETIKVASIDNNSLLSKNNILKENDVIKSIKINNIETIIKRNYQIEELVITLSENDNFSITVLRNNNEITDGFVIEA